MDGREGRQPQASVGNDAERCDTLDLVRRGREEQSEQLSLLGVLCVAGPEAFPEAAGEPVDGPAVGGNPMNEELRPAAFPSGTANHEQP